MQITLVTLPGAGVNFSKFKKVPPEPEKKNCWNCSACLANGPIVSNCVQKKKEMMEEMMWENFSSSFNITEPYRIWVLLKDPPLSPVPLLLIWYSVCVGCMNHLALTTTHYGGRGGISGNLNSLHHVVIGGFLHGMLYICHTVALITEQLPGKARIHCTAQWLIAASHHIISGSFLVVLCMRLTVSTPRHGKTLIFYQSSATNLLGLLRNPCRLCTCIWAEWL